MPISSTELNELKNTLSGELYFDAKMRTLYATDASVYREMPLAVAYPKGKEDIRILINFALRYQTSLIPRTAGTSLGGQVVGNGIIVDVSKYFNRILEVNVEERWAWVEPGVVRDDLNRYLAPHKLWFGPETSTANRAMIGGMVGNNSCGSYSIVYKTTREHVLELETILSDGSEAHFGILSNEEYTQKRTLKSLEGLIYNDLYELLEPEAVRRELEKEFPKKEIHRRNTGYAIDLLARTNIFESDGVPFNMCALLAGSEGTLAFTTKIKVNLEPIPPKEKVVVCAHFHDLQESLEAVVAIMAHQPRALEMIDDIILNCTKSNIEQQKNRFFVEGEPKSVLIVEFWAETKEAINAATNKLIDDLRSRNMGYAYPLVYGNDISKIWHLRKAGLGLLANIPGDPKAVAVIEDTAVEVSDLPAYISEFTKMMESYGQQSVYYAHAGAGELHLRPILDLKTQEGKELFRKIATDSAHLVKKYKGSLSGEHGDGRVRGEFIPIMVGEKNYQLLRKVKQIWDPEHIFNPGKIVDTPPMDAFLRYDDNHQHRDFNTTFNFQEDGGILRAAEKCNGSGDCRKSPGAGGTMCPSYMATRYEKDTTRARANILREFLTRSEKVNKFNHQEIYEVMDLCLSCKGCTSECPSNVDIPTLKAEFLQQYYEANGVPLRSKVFGNIAKINSLAYPVRRLANWSFRQPFTAKIIANTLGISPKRSFPAFSKQRFKSWLQDNARFLSSNTKNGTVYIFADEFTDFNDANIGIKACQLLVRLGYEVKFVDHAESGRAQLSKGLVKNAQKAAKKNFTIFNDLITAETPLIGIEPSAILSFRDEYPKLVDKKDYYVAKDLGKNCLLIDEFIYNEVQKGKISSEQFTGKPQKVLLHGHCHQKALSSVDKSAFLLSLPKNYTVEIIPSGCCGMAGSFGYEKEHYDISMQVGALVLFPKVKQAEKDTIIAAPGTSCRHQIHDGTGKMSQHPVEVLWEAVCNLEG
ncbi:MAG: FAD-binding protein [Chitinophagales bacterium]|nr:FAD-binding protein [Chitinophagales bacterium]